MAKKAPVGPTGTRAERGTDFVESVSRGISILECYNSELANRQRGRLTLADAAGLTDLSRGTARRLLLTLKALHYLDTDGKYFWLTPRVLNLSKAYKVPLGLGEASIAVMQMLTARLGESVSVGVLDEDSIVYVERVEMRRIYSSNIISGTRLPASCTSIGRVLLAALSEAMLNAWIERYGLSQMTAKTITDRKQFLEIISNVREQGYATVDEELEIGIRSIAVPIVGDSGQVVAAINCSTSSAGCSIDTLVTDFLPQLLDGAESLSVSMNW